MRGLSEITYAKRCYSKACVICNYCAKPAEFVSGKVIYPHRPDLYFKKFYLCVPCDAYVGCHPRSGRPLGRVANKLLRAWKMKAHAYFDPIWKTKTMSRSSAYKWLAGQLGIDVEVCHIGMFDVDMCIKVVETVKNNSPIITVR